MDAVLPPVTITDAPPVVLARRQADDDFPRAHEQPAVLLDLDDNRRRALGRLMAMEWLREIRP